MGLLKDLANAPARALQALLSDKKDESTNLSEKSKEIILSIREYEDSVEMPEDERITCLDSDRKVHLIAGNDKAQDFAGYAAECQEYRLNGNNENRNGDGAQMKKAADADGDSRARNSENEPCNQEAKTSHNRYLLSAVALL